jgi:multiple sugar transport system ATP-binding protein
VATFIGNPTMNIFEATVVKEDKQILLSFEKNKLRVDQATGQKLLSRLNQTLNVGVRPQNIHHHLSRAGRRFTDTQIDMDVDIVESLGDKDMIVGKTGSVSLTFLADPDLLVESGKSMSAVIDGRKLHFFDIQTHERIF